MVKGCEKRVVRWKDPDSRIFEEVLFILRDETGHGPLGERDIVAEANRILQESTGVHEGHPKKRVSLPSFCLGALLAAAVALPFIVI